jgi:hypothetical protein
MRLTLVIAAIALMAACGSSSNKSATTSSSTTASTASAATASAAKTAALPDPCTLLTTDDVAAFFDGEAITAKPSTGPAPGVAQCSFNLSVGAQAKQVNIETLTDFATNPAYVFPSPVTTVPGVGELAVIEASNTNEHRITVKLGANAIQITVDFYDKPVDDAFLTQLARLAVGRT